MRNIFSRKEFVLAIACALVLGVFSETVRAQPARDIDEHDRHVFIEISGTGIAK